MDQPARSARGRGVGQSLQGLGCTDRPGSHAHKKSSTVLRFDFDGDFKGIQTSARKTGGGSNPYGDLIPRTGLAPTRRFFSAAENFRTAPARRSESQWPVPAVAGNHGRPHRVFVFRPGGRGVQISTILEPGPVGWRRASFCELPKHFFPMPRGGPSLSGSEKSPRNSGWGGVGHDGW
jgi:hypothetical protein